MLRKLIAVGALLLATMCLAVPAAYAGAGLVFDDPVSIDLVAAPADFAVVATDPAVEVAVPIVAENCSNTPAWVAVETTGGLKAERLPSCRTTGRYDPGWRAS